MGAAAAKNEEVSLVPFGEITQADVQAQIARFDAWLQVETHNLVTYDRLMAVISS